VVLVTKGGGLVDDAGTAVRGDVGIEEHAERPVGPLCGRQLGVLDPEQRALGTLS
jgi:hypothetical protein